MEIVTKAYGQVEIDPDWILTFENGLVGFEDRNRYVILSNPDANDMIVWLQSLEDENLAFVLIKPEAFRPDYQPKVHYSELADLDITAESDPNDLCTYAIAVVPEEIKNMTANLRAPLIINLKNKKAKQIVLNDDTYKVKEPVFANK